MTNIILCGGSGTRLWPISRSLMPKQFVKIFNDKSLFQLTMKRNQEVSKKQLLVTNTEHYFLALDQLEEERKNVDFLLEPTSRNTAPAIALACMALNPEEIVLVTPSDHLIGNIAEYKIALEQAKKFAQEGYIVTFGIEPEYPEVGFGYIESKGFDVKAFHEKPTFEVAQKYLQEGNYYWNSGMFCFKAGDFLEQLKKYSNNTFEYSALAFDNKSLENNLMRIQYEDMLKIPEESIDYAVMEKSDKIKVIPSNLKWSDLGTFESLYTELNKDDTGNTLNTSHIAIDSKNNLIYGSERKIVTIDIDDTIVVDTGDALLISKKGSSQKVKNIVTELKQSGSELPDTHLKGYRPWGTYTILEDSMGYKIKKIEVQPGKRLSLQKHFYRNEHWIVVSGVATVTVDDKRFILNSNESTYIKAGQIHRLENEGSLPLVIIEAQVGEYTGEDDIVRIEDDYKRD